MLLLTATLGVISAFFSLLWSFLLFALAPPKSHNRGFVSVPEQALIHRTIPLSTSCCFICQVRGRTQ